MRILFVNPYYKPYLGGIERIIEQVGSRLARMPGVSGVGVLTTRVAFPDQVMGQALAHEVIDGIDVFRCDFYPPRIPRVYNASIAGYVSLRARAVLRRFSPDVVHFTYGEWWGGNAFLYGSSRSRAHVLSTGFHERPRGATYAPLRFVNRRLVPRMDVVHVLTELEGRQVTEEYGADPRQLIVIPPGVDPAPVVNRSGRETTTILAVGRLSAHKGQLDLVRMVHELSGRLRNGSVRLSLVGDDSEFGDTLHEYVTDNSLGRSVTYHGRADDEELADLYRSADIFALPTRYESFGVVFLEAMAHGLPVVTYSVGPVAGILTAGAVLVPPGDTGAFLNVLDELVQDPPRRRRLGADGRALVASQYSWDRAAHDYLRMYERVLAGS